MPEIISTRDADYVYDIVKKVCSEVGPGLPGSPQERERADIIKKELESHVGIDNVAIEEFTFAPGAFLSSYPICGIFMLFAALLNISVGHIMGISPWLTSIAALAFSIMVPLPFIFEFVLAFELFDPLFRKKKSVNVIGTLCEPGTKIVKRMLIISGHHDSAPENTWLRFLGYGFFILLATFFDELRRLDVRLLNIETVASPEVVLLTSDINGTKKNSPEMVKSVVAAAERAGIPFKVKPATLGTANDSGPFSQAGLKAMTLLAFRIPQQMVSFYHQKWDNPDILTIEPLLNVLKLTFEWVRNGGE